MLDQVTREILDLSRKDGDLNLRRTGIVRVRLVFVYDALLLALIEHICIASALVGRESACHCTRLTVSLANFLAGEP